MTERSISLSLKVCARKLGQVQLLETANVIVVVLVEVAEVLTMGVDVSEHVNHIVLRLKPENSLRFLAGNLVISEVLKILDFDCNLFAGQFLDTFLDHVSNG